MKKTSITSLCVSVLALVIAVVSLFSHANSKLVGNVVNQDLQQFPYGITLGSGNTFDQYVPLVINARQNQASWCNNTGYTVYVRNYVGELIGTATSGTASSTGGYRFYVGTSTAATVTDTALPPALLVDTAVIATGTLMTSQVLNSDVGGGTLGKGVIAVANTKCVFSALESTGFGTVSPTSTSRGFNINGFLQYTSLGNI